ncbi:MAG: LamG domain-containing protein, partial [Eubacteriales bacterium]|nr:LamG domain-containing protein [Eubacteriales bacterium]
MKKITLAVIMVYVLTLLSPLAMFGTWAQTQMPEDYIAAWDFETETGGKITDISANGYHGTIRIPTYMSRQAGQGYAGSAGLVISTDVTGNDTQMNAPGLGRVIREKREISIAGWYKYEGTFDKERYIFNIPNTQGYTGLAASVLENERIKFQVRTTAASGNLKSVTTPSNVTMPSDWVHLTFIVSMPQDSTGKGALAVYINGIKVIEDTNVDVNSMASLETLGTDDDYDFRLGGQGSSPFVGKIDDVKIYDRVLTQAEIAVLATPMEEPEPIEPEDDYIAAWDFETETGGKITDISANGYHGTIRIPTYMSRQAGQGYAGSAGLVISTDVTGNDTQMNAPGLGRVIREKREISIAGWYKYEGTFDKERYIFNIPNTQGYTGLAASVLENERIKFQVRTTAASGNLKSVTTPSNVTMPSDWVHLTFIVSMPQDSTGKGALAVYINGIKVIEDTNVDVNSMTSLETLGTEDNYDFRLGGQGSSPFVGKIDDVKIYDRVLTQGEITALATPADEEPETPIDPEMVLEYDFEELTEDNKVVDTSGKGNDGTFSTAGIYQSV